MSRSPTTRIAAVLTIACAAACMDASRGTSPPFDVTPATAATARHGGRSRDPGSTSTLQWNAIARQVVRARVTDPVTTNRPSANAQVRIYAYLGLAQYEAVLAAQSPGEARGRPGSESAPHERASTRAAVAAASAAVLSYFLPLDAPFLEGQLRAQESAEPTPAEAHRGFAKGEEIGREVAGRIIARADADRFAAPFTGTIPVGPQFWRSSTVPPTPPLLPMMGKMRTFFLTSGDQFRPAPPPVYGSPEHLAALAEVRHYSDTRTPEQTEIAKFWAPPSLSSYFDEELSGMVERRGLSERRAAHAYALSFMAALDALVACHDAKYTYWFPRPTQVDPAITLTVALPNHPSYPSNHACIDGALDVVWSRLFPDEATRIHALMEQGMLSRVYGGLHYRFDGEVGLAMGREVGGVALKANRHVLRDALE